MASVLAGLEQNDAPGAGRDGMNGVRPDRLERTPQGKETREVLAHLGPG